MDKDALLKSIAETGYNVGFGAKSHFATYDLVETVPGWITFISLAVGILGLAVEQLSQKLPASVLLVFGVVGLYVSAYDSRKAKYDETGSKLTKLFYELRDLYRTVQSGGDLTAAQATLKTIETQYFDISISKQIFLSNWYAHYKFFWEMQIDWIDEQKKFKLLRDKIPLSFTAFCAVLVISGAAAAVATNPPAVVKNIVCEKPAAPKSHPAPGAAGGGGVPGRPS